MTYASAAPCSQEPTYTPIGSAPHFPSQAAPKAFGVASADPSPENGCEKSPALFDALYLLAGAIAGLVVLAVWAVR